VSLTLEIGPERPDDFKGIRALLERAFPTRDEAWLVDTLRSQGAHVPSLCLVAVDADADEVIGHIFYSRAKLRPSGVPVLALAPMAVAPERQRAGVGAALIRESLRLAGSTDFPLIVVVGHASYYPRFGAEPAGPLGIEAPFKVPPESWMAWRLPAWTPAVSGRVEYHPSVGKLT
jgi:putative acetyltransferase